MYSIQILVVLDGVAALQEGLLLAPALQALTLVLSEDEALRSPLLKKGVLLYVSLQLGPPLIGP